MDSMKWQTWRLQKAVLHFLPCTPIDAKTAKKKELQRKQSGEDVCTELENLQFAEVDLPHDWAVSRPFNKVMEDGMSQGFRDRWGIGWYKKDSEY